MPLITFIIPYYNLPLALVKECVDSIIQLPLDREEREIIVVDDGSTLSIEKDLDAAYEGIVYIRQKNGGPGAARNAGIEKATGEYIQFVDGDDRLVADNYACCIDKLRELSPDMLMFNWTYGKARHGECRWEGPVSGAAYMRKKNLRAVVWAYVFRRQLVENIRFTPNIYHEDEEFTARIVLKVKTLFFTSCEVYFYRLRQQSITTTRNDSLHINKRLDNMEMVINNLFKDAERLKGEEKQGMERRVAQLSMDYIFNVARLTRSAAELEKRISNLRKSRLYPLPNKSYTYIYILFRTVTNTRLGRRLLILAVSLLNYKR